jgi:hypothetical protein
MPERVSYRIDAIVVALSVLRMAVQAAFISPFLDASTYI